LKVGQHGCSFVTLLLSCIICVASKSLFSYWWSQLTNDVCWVQLAKVHPCGCFWNEDDKVSLGLNYPQSDTSQLGDNFMKKKKKKAMGLVCVIPQVMVL
jgi:hypothetical protein